MAKTTAEEQNNLRRQAKLRQKPPKRAPHERNKKDESFDLGELVRANRIREKREQEQEQKEQAQVDGVIALADLMLEGKGKCVMMYDTPTLSPWQFLRELEDGRFTRVKVGRKLYNAVFYRLRDLKWFVLQNRQKTELNFFKPVS